MIQVELNANYDLRGLLPNSLQVAMGKSIRKTKNNTVWIVFKEDAAYEHFATLCTFQGFQFDRK